MKASAAAVAAVVLVAACASGSATTDTAAGPDVGGMTPAAQQGLLAARTATAPFQRFEAADSAGYRTLFMDKCMDDPSLGGMGYHYVNTGLVDGELDVARPEALMYERGADGQFKLVGLEYVIPKNAWTSDDPPVLMGQELALNAFDLWALHVWIWKDNPSGVFASWNPEVRCGR